MGLRPWNDTHDPDDDIGAPLWLLPGEWYAHLPEGYVFVDIFGNEEVFQRGVTDNDTRFGCLAFGVIGPEK